MKYQNNHTLFFLATLIAAFQIIAANCLAKEPELLSSFFEEQAKLKQISESNPKLSHWYLLKKGIYQLGNNQPREAYKTLAKISESSAAAPEALLYMSEIQFGVNPQRLGDADFKKIESKINAGKRDDLKARFFLLKGDFYRNKRRTKEARVNYLKIIRSYPFSKCAPNAFTALDKISPKKLASLKQLKSQAKFLKFNSQLEKSEEFLRAAKSKVKRNSEEYFLLTLEEAALKKAAGDKQTSAALIKQVSRQKFSNKLANNSYLNLILAYWNIGQKDEALKEIKNLKATFPTSSHNSKAAYIKARILGEKNLYVESKETYIALINELEKRRSLEKSEKTYYLKSLKELAWLYLNNSLKDKAKLYFRKLSKESVRLNDSHYSHHSYYWLKKLEEPNPYSAQKLLGPFNYYSLELDKSHIHKLLNENRGSKICKPELQPSLSSSLSSLKNAGFFTLAQHEVNWSLRGSLNKSKSINKNSSLSDLKSYANASHAFLEAGSSQQGLLLAGKAVRSLAPNFQSFSSYKPGSYQAACLTEFIKLYYPSPFLHIYKKESANYKVPLSLILALSRTESHFRANAVSPVQAKGLMQLMQKTAELEGLQPGEDLFNPEVNIRLGVKHLARVINYYGNDLPPAIASYNSGKKAVDRWRERYKKLPKNYWPEQIGYPETYNYVQKVTAAKLIYEALSTIR